MRIPLFTLLFVLLAGCTTVEAPKTNDHASPIADVLPTARLTIYRPSSSVQYAGRSASLKLNAKSIGGISSGDFRVVEVPPGSHSLEADMWDAPGRCTITFTVRAGESAYFEVAPRLANLAAGTPGAVLPAAGAAGTLVGGAVMLAGMSAESSGKQCGGAFSIEQTASEVASMRLGSLRAAK